MTGSEMNRRELITALRDLADYLQKNPDVPADAGFISVSCYINNGSAKERMPQIGAAMERAGGAVQDNNGSYLSLSRKFGPIRFSNFCDLEAVCDIPPRPTPEPPVFIHAPEAVEAA